MKTLLSSGTLCWPTLVFLLACGHQATQAPVSSTPKRATVVALSPTPTPDPCMADMEPAADAMRAFRAELLASAATDLQKFQESLPARMAAFREKNRTVLAEQAIWTLKQMPKMAMPELEAMSDDPRVTPEVASRIQGVLAEDQDGESFQAFLGLLSANPAHAFAGVRGVVLGVVGSPGDLDRRREDILEGLAPTPIVRLNDDLDHPILAMPKRADIFVVWFDHDDSKGIFMPKRIRWARRDPPAQPNHDVKTAEEVLRAFASAVETIQPREGDTTVNLSTRLLAQVGEVAKQWLDPHALLLRDHGTCSCKKLPKASMPDLANWKEEEGPWNLVLMTSMFPRLRWDPEQAFLFVRTSVDSRTMKVGDYSGLAFVDSLAPPTVHRATDDLNDPVLFLMEGDTCLVVPFSSSPERGYFPTQVRYFRRK